MTSVDLPPGAPVFLDANVLVYHFISHAVFGAACSALIHEIEMGGREGFTSVSALSDTSHQLMTFETTITLVWPSTGTLRRLKRNSSQISLLSRFRDAVNSVANLGIQVMPVSGDMVTAAVDLCKQHGLFTDDAILVATMQDAGLIHLASNDADFDRVPSIVRYSPV